MHPVQKERMEKHPSFHSDSPTGVLSSKRNTHLHAYAHTLLCTHITARKASASWPGRKPSQLLFPSQQETSSMAQW